MSPFADTSTFSRMRAANNLRSLPEKEAAHIEWLFGLKIKDLMHAISTMVPTTGGTPNPRHIKMLEVMWDLEKAFKFRDGVLNRIKNALRKNRAK